MVYVCMFIVYMFVVCEHVFNECLWYMCYEYVYMLALCVLVVCLCLWYVRKCMLMVCVSVCNCVYVCGLCVFLLHSMSIWVHVTLCVRVEYRKRTYVFSLVTLILTALK